MDHIFLDVTRMLGTTGRLLKIVRGFEVLTKICYSIGSSFKSSKILQILVDLSGPCQVPAKIVEGLIAPLKSSIACFNHWKMFSFTD